VWGTGQAGRAQGGCLGTKSRRKTRQAAKSCGEGHMPGDPQVSEWGNPHGGSPNVSMRQHITHGGKPGELNLVAGGRERNIDSQSSGERNGRGPNRGAQHPGVRTARMRCAGQGNGFGKASRRG